MQQKQHRKHFTILLLKSDPSQSHRLPFKPAKSPGVKTSGIETTQKAFDHLSLIIGPLQGHKLPFKLATSPMLRAKTNGIVMYQSTGTVIVCKGSLTLPISFRHNFMVWIFLLTYRLKSLASQF